MSTPVQIDTLTDEQAITLLALVIDHTNPLPDPHHQRQLDNQLREAANTTATEPTTTTQTVTAGELARDTLAYLATTPAATTIARAAAVNHAATRLDPATLTIGALVLLALQTEIELTRKPTGQWTLHIHKKAATDTTITTLVTKLVAFFRPPHP